MRGKAQNIVYHNHVNAWEGKLEIYTNGAAVNEKESSEYCISQPCKWEGKLGINGAPVNERESSGKIYVTQ